MEDILKQIYGYLAEYGLDIIAAILIFVIGRWLAKVISKLVAKVMTKAKVAPILVRFAQNALYIAILAFVIIAALEKAGVRTSSAVVALGAVGLAIGLAWQGSLSNFAAGILMVIFRPVRVGDFVEVGGVKGTVREVQILNTILDSPDNVRIIVPNSQVTGGKIENYTVNGTRRVDMTVGVSYEDDLSKAREIIEGVLAQEDRILKDPPPTVAVSELGDSSVNFVVRPWVRTADYWAVRFAVTEKIKVALDNGGITIPFPQRDIHVKNGPAPGAKAV
ncbi:MAG: mechanosensitive ion channel [Phycisphaerales bacterium]|nr:MAG: mechanosensitive ion channel [Phycisphaerales bacterium]